MDMSLSKLWEVVKEVEASEDYSLVAVFRLFIAVASPVAEHRL